MGETTEFAVRAETLEGNVMTLRGGFATKDDAEDHPVTMSLWRRVWVEPVTKFKQPSVPMLPPFPWDWVASGAVDARGQYHAYIVDATGRKIGAVWCKDGEKKLVADYIVASANAAAAIDGSGGAVEALYPKTESVSHE